MGAKERTFRLLAKQKRYRDCRRHINGEGNMEMRCAPAAAPPKGEEERRAPNKECDFARLEKKGTMQQEERQEIAAMHPD